MNETYQIIKINGVVFVERRVKGVLVNRWETNNPFGLLNKLGVSIDRDILVFEPSLN